MSSKDKAEKYVGPGRLGQAYAVGSAWTITGAIIAPFAFLGAVANLIKNALNNIHDSGLMHKMEDAIEAELMKEQGNHPMSGTGPIINGATGHIEHNVVSPLENFFERDGEELINTLKNTKGGKLVAASLLIVPTATLIGVVRGWHQAGKTRKQFDRLSDRDLIAARLEASEKVAGALKQQNEVLSQAVAGGYANRMQARAGFGAERLAEKEAAASAETIRS